MPADETPDQTDYSDVVHLIGGRPVCHNTVHFEPPEPVTLHDAGFGGQDITYEPEYAHPEDGEVSDERWEQILAPFLTQTSRCVDDAEQLILFEYSSLNWVPAPWTSNALYHWWRGQGQMGRFLFALRHPSGWWGWACEGTFWAWGLLTGCCWCGHFKHSHDLGRDGYGGRCQARVCDDYCLGYSRRSQPKWLRRLKEWL